MASNDGKIKENYIAAPDPANMFEWYFVVFGLKDSPYEGGFYMGRLLFPQDYPWKPPAIFMVSETGRFKPGTRICLSISDYHPDTWSPLWNVGSIIVGLISFMITEDRTVGSIETPIAKRKQIAQRSIETLSKNVKFEELFSDW